MWAALLTLSLCVRALLASSVSSACDSLRNQTSLPYYDLPVRLQSGEELNVTVMGAGSVSRPAAAALWALLRYGLGYAARLRLRTPDLCQLTDLAYDSSLAVNVVAPLASMPSAGCVASRNLTFDSLTSHAVGVDDSLRLLAHVAPARPRGQGSGGRLRVGENLLRNCGFMKSKQFCNVNCRECECSPSSSSGPFAIFVSKQHASAVEELIECIEVSRLPFQFVYFRNESQWKKKLHELRTSNLTFLFVEGDLWTGDLNVFRVDFDWNCRPSSKRTFGFRVGDGGIIRLNAPTISVVISNLLNNISSYYEDLQQINNLIVNDTSLTDNEEAACTWADRNYERFRQLIPYNFNNRSNVSVYDVVVFLCHNDSENGLWINVLRNARTLLNKYIERTKYHVEYNLFKCHDGTLLKKYIKAYEGNHLIAGLITWGWTQAASMAAPNANIPLFLAGPIAPEMLLNEQPHVRTTAGSLTDIFRAYENLFQRCKWSRIAFLSETGSAYSESFINHFNLGQKQILYREINIMNSNDIPSALKRLQVDDSRIIVINANWNLTGTILCCALDEGMTGVEYVWIAREELRKVECDHGKQWDTMRYYTLELMLQKGPKADESKELQNPYNVTTTKPRQDLPHEMIDAMNTDSSGLASALLQLGFGLNRFLHKYPSQTYTFHRSNVSMFLKINEVTLTDNKTYQRDQLILINKWKGYRGNTVAMWYIASDRIFDVGRNVDNAATCEEIIGNKLADRAFCLLPSNDSYDLRCHDVLIVTSTCVLILIFLILYLIYRRRLSSIQYHREQYEKYLIESRQQATSILDGYMVKRNSIQLYHIIGLGSFGLIRFAKLHKSRSETVIVAAKEPRDSFGVEEENLFLREACVLAPLSHDNIIRLVGVCLGEGPILVLMEHALYNDLQQYLTLRRQFVEGTKSGRISAEQAREVSDEELTRLAQEAAEALVYLASCRLVHRDVRAGNCLIDKNRSLKLADFGMARELDGEEPQYTTQRRALFPVLWMAPESIQSGIFSQASDVWSLGVLLLEIATFGARPFGDWSVDRVVRYVKTGGHAPLPPDISTYTRRLVLECWNYDPDARPKAEDVRGFLSRNPNAISPALLTPHPPESPIQFTNAETNRNPVTTRSICEDAPLPL